MKPSLIFHYTQIFTMEKQYPTIEFVWLRVMYQWQIYSFVWSNDRKYHMNTEITTSFDVSTMLGVHNLKPLLYLLLCNRDNLFSEYYWVCLLCRATVIQKVVDNPFVCRLIELRRLRSSILSLPVDFPFLCRLCFA